MSDAHALSAAQEVVRRTDVLLQAWEPQPPMQRRDGGLSMRDIRALAKLMTPVGHRGQAKAQHDVSGHVRDDAGADAHGTVRADASRRPQHSRPQQKSAQAHTRQPSTQQSSLQEASSLVQLALTARLIAADWTGASALNSRSAAQPAAIPYALTTRVDLWESRDMAHRWAMLATAWARSIKAWQPAGTGAGAGASTGSGTGAGACEGRLLGVMGPGSDSQLATGLAQLSPQCAPGQAEQDMAALLAAQLPPVSDQLLIQGDLTGVIPGQPSAELEQLISCVAQVESRSVATVVRFTPQSVARAMARGVSEHELLTRLRSASPYPLPQALEYVIRDGARQQASQAGSRLGGAQAGRLSGSRAGTQPGTTQASLPPRLDVDGPWGLGDTATVLHEAIRDKQLVDIQLAGPSGDVVTRTVQPTGLHGGRLRAVDLARETELTMVVHRIVSVTHHSNEGPPVQASPSSSTARPSSPNKPSKTGKPNKTGTSTARSSKTNTSKPQPAKPTASNPSPSRRTPSP